MLEKEQATQLLELAKAQREYIMALPEDVVASLPAMPGFDGDWADETIDDAEKTLRNQDGV